MTETTQLIYTHALELAPDISNREEELLKELCFAAEVSLQRKLRRNILMKDCHNQFVAAASMYALAALSEISEESQFAQVAVGDLTIRKTDGTVAANCLRKQADMLMAPYVKSGVAFMGV
ncbi:MAG: hypothetical protein IJO72_03050 [Oscillospiraceae bacterium]|nr:hypothetical protein [Oscillospiraceae bacterium]MBQ9929738.1 hypothetical protein [Oscillospiraceae bacterium]